MIFDVDGTLVDAIGIDNACYVEAFRQVHGLPDMDTDWARYEHCTDTWIGRTVLSAHFGREPTGDELTAVRDRFVALLAAARDREPARFRPVAGALDVWTSFRAAGSPWSVAIGTGGWRTSAHFKLTASGFDVGGVPGGYADDSPTREGIIAAALARSAAAAGRAAERVVYVGDAVWDVRACAATGTPFVGVAHGPRAGRLRAEGAALVLADLSDRAAFLDALDRAVPPAS